MKKTLILTVLALMILCVGQAFGDPEIKTSGQIRLRCEFDNDPNNSFDTAAATVNTTFLRTRFNVDATINENTSAYIQFQDSRKFGTLNSSGIGVDTDDKVYLHQAYFKINELWENGIGLKAGRFEVNLGNQRVFGGVGWHNEGRTWDGMELICDGDGYAVSGYFLRPRDDFDTTESTDFNIFGLNAKIKSLNLELLAFLEKDAARVDTTIGVDTFTPTHDALGRINLGLFFHRSHKQFDFALNAVYQMGKRQIWEVTATDTGSVEEDIAAMMFTFEAGYTFDGKMKPRLAVGIDYSSGDDDATDDKFKAYNNLYYTGHKFRGYMDYFLASKNSGLMDLMFRAKLNPVEGWTVKGDLHLFTTAVEYSYAGSNIKDRGMELDFSVATNKISGAKWVTGLSLFMPKEGFTMMTDNEDMTMWAYTMFIVGF
ncbi:MAG: alginate export family protein [candidate division Zixibacteria bacterium]|nr:alginate export family protein [candidate division Zixibacteria bacterium]